MLKMGRSRLVQALLSMALAGLLLAGCASGGGGSTADSKTIKIGFVAPLTGASAQDGEAMRKGALLAADLVNSKGGINGKKIEIVAQDDKSDPKEAAAVANKFASDTSIMAVVGHFNSSCTLAGAPIYNKAGVVEISPGSSSPAVSGVGPYTFRTITTDAFQGQYLANWAVKEEGFKRIAVIYENTDYGQGIANVIDSEAAKLGATIVAKETYILGETKDFSAIISKVKAASPDVIIVGGLYNETALIEKQARRSSLAAPFMGVDGIYSDALIKLGAEATEGTRLTGFFHNSSKKEQTQNFIKAYKEKYKEEPGTYAAYSYDAASLIIEALQNGKSDRKGIMEYLAGVKNFKGATGDTSFDAKHDAIKEPLKLIVKDGKFQVYSK